MKKTDIFDKLDNVIGNYMEGKATEEDVVNIATKVNIYLIKNAHPHDVINNRKMKPISIIRTIFTLFVFGAMCYLFDYNVKGTGVPFAVAMCVLTGLAVLLSAVDMIRKT